MTHPRRAAWTLTALYAAFHFLMTHLPPGNVPGLRVSNYLLHLLSYGFLAGCAYLSLWLGGMPLKRTALIVIACTAVFAAIDEVLQAPIGRQPEFMDWVVDVGGAIVAAGCLSSLRVVFARRASRSEDARPPLAVSQDS